jgi:PilZ domain
MIVMPTATLQQVADTVIRRAQRQGYVVPREVRGELRLAGLDEDCWKEAVALARGSLIYRQGRYYHKAAVSPRLEQEQRQRQTIAKALRPLIRQHRRRVREQERRSDARIDFVQTVKVQTEDGKEYTLLTRDLSPTGVRLIGTCRLLGQKVHLVLPRDEGEEPYRLLTRILWTCAVGDDLFENGGSFLELV